jgi:tripartite-type tricarboxylate transporter receptor subunit TctC
VIDSASGLPFLRDGRVRALCVLSEARSAPAANVPTLRELGWPDAIAYGWQGISLPAGAPPAVIDRVHDALTAGVEADDVKARFRDLGIEGAALSPAGFQAFVEAENAVWRPLIRDLGIRLDG